MECSGSHYNLFGDHIMKILTKLWNAIKAAKEIRARAVIARAHWY